LEEAVLAGLDDLRELDTMFVQFQLEPATWLASARAMQDRWDTYMAKAAEMLIDTQDEDRAADIIESDLDPWAEEYRRFISNVIIAPGNAAMGWKLVIELRMDAHGRMPGEYQAIMAGFRAEADAIVETYRELKAYADSDVDTGIDATAHARRRAEARALVVYARNLGSALTDKQRNLIQVFQEGDPNNFKDTLDTMVAEYWDIDGEYRDYPHVLPAWKQLVVEWVHACVEAYDEFVTQYENAKEACLPIIEGTLFSDYPLFRGLYFSNLDRNVLALQARIDGM
jgi:hypothetical protein